MEQDYFTPQTTVESSHCETEFPSTSSSECLVCTNSAHGVHFGVSACRACAAFFRRTVVMNKKYACRRANSNCDITKDIRYLCRYCRFNKCLRVGMTTENVQWNRDALSSSIKKEKMERVELSEEKLDDERIIKEESVTMSDRQSVTPGSSSSVIHFGGNMKPSTSRTREVPINLDNCFGTKFMDTTKAGVEDVFQNFVPTFTESPHLTALQRMSIGIEKLRRTQNMNPKVLEFVNVRRLHALWGSLLVEVAELMMHCEEFASLQLQEKLKIFRYSWCSVHRLDKVSVSLEIFGEEVFTHRKIAMFRDLAVCDSTRFDMTEISNYSAEEIKKMFHPFVNQMLVEIAHPIVQERFSLYEIVYMICLLMWNVEGCDVSEETLRTAESYRIRVSNELHDYYVHTLRRPNYAERMIKLMKLVKAIEKVQDERARIFEMARLFDVFKFDFPTSDIIDFKRM